MIEYKANGGCDPRQLRNASDDNLQQLNDTTAISCSSSGSLCRKFETCNAPQCPIDPPSLESPYYSGEPICVWLLEFAKAESRPELGSAIGDIPLKAIAEAYEQVFIINGTIRGRLKRASRTPSRLKIWERVA